MRWGSFRGDWEAALARGKVRRFACVITMRGRDVYLLPRIPAARALARWICARSDVVLAAAASNVRECIDRVLGAPSRARVMPSGVDTSTSARPPRRASRARSRAGSCFFIGRLDEQKGLDVLLRALPRVRERHPGLGRRAGRRTARRRAARARGRARSRAVGALRWTGRPRLVWQRISRRAARCARPIDRRSARPGRSDAERIARGARRGRAHGGDRRGRRAGSDRARPQRLVRARRPSRRHARPAKAPKAPPPPGVAIYTRRCARLGARRGAAHRSLRTGTAWWWIDARGLNPLCVFARYTPAKESLAAWAEPSGDR